MTSAMPMNTAISGVFEPLMRAAATVMISTRHLIYSGTPVYLPTARLRTEAARRSSATGFKKRCGLCLNSAARLEDGVDLRAVLDDLPGAGEAGRDHERIAGSKAAALAARALDGDLAGGHHAQLILGVAHAPFTARRRPAPGKKLLTDVAEIIAHLQLRPAGD